MGDPENRQEMLKLWDQRSRNDMQNPHSPGQTGSGGHDVNPSQMEEVGAGSDSDGSEFHNDGPGRLRAIPTNLAGNCTAHSRLASAKLSARHRRAAGSAAAVRATAPPDSQPASVSAANILPAPHAVSYAEHGAGAFQPRGGTGRTGDRSRMGRTAEKAVRPCSGITGKGVHEVFGGAHSGWTTENLGSGTPDPRISRTTSIARRKG